MSDNELQKSRPVSDPEEKSYDYPIGLHYSLHDSQFKPVILKSDAMKTYMERDGMSFEEAEEFWGFNMGGVTAF